MKKASFLLFLTLSISSCKKETNTDVNQSPNYIVDNSPRDWSSFVEIRNGNMPLLIIAPHGGEERPEWIDDRNCTNATVVQDQYTRDIALLLEENLKERGLQPFLVVSNIHRIKIDLNRSLADSFCYDDSSNPLWSLFHNQIVQFRKEIEQNYGRGLLIDLHGHGHPIQKIELGYLRNGADLRDFVLNPENTTTAMVSIRNAVENHPQGQSLSNLLVGSEALGTQLSARGFPAIPSEQHRAPGEGDSFFSGGYITQMYGSQESGKIDAIQLELNREGLRDTNDNRIAFSSVLTEILLDYLSIHYSDVFSP